MPLLHIIILALIQGITEFLPISSSGHLVLAHAALDGNAAQEWDKHILMDVAVHVGTLFSVLLYFRKDVILMVSGILSLLTGKWDHTGNQLTLKIIIGSIPVIIIGFWLNAMNPSWLLAVEIVAWTTLIFGIVLWIADRMAPNEKTLDELGYKHALIIGLAQCLALIPGTSRSGITMTAARFLGYNRSECAHYSLLLGIIAISGAGALGGLELLNNPNASLSYDVLIAAILSFISGYIAIVLMMKWLSRASFTPFAIYRIILGIALLAVIYATDWL
ncbi:MAG: undecaprenyl-diphosphate phosphatase [Alphaproteobacteria bacterium]|nr:undecaprenyl-diphosphate phosphatase [Alphaproteobacteria bacterium]